MTNLLNPSQQLILIVDPYSTGCMVAQEITKRGYQIMAIWTKGFSDEMKTHVPVSCRDLTYVDQVQDELHWSLDDLVRAVDQAKDRAARKIGKDDGYYTIVGCIAGGEAGVDMADLLSEKLGVLSNGTKGDFANRRDKRVQQDLVRDAGLRAVRQACGEKFEDVEEFLRSEQFPVVLKPTDSAGSDGVKLCHSFEQAKEHFHHLLTVEAVNGGYNTQVLCQEFLQGKEYVVDHVSRNGVHKTMMVWVYDKRPRNGSQFVYFGMLPIDPTSDEAKVLIPYTRGVLDALGMRHGPSHGEIIITNDGPCLVEMNCRAHGGDGNWTPLARALTGSYCQVDVTANAYLDEEEFHKVPDVPPSPLKAHGLEINLVSYSKGKVKSMPGFDVIKKLPSFVWLSPAVSIGSEVEYTIDLITSPGCCVLMNSDKDVLKKDVDFIRYLEEINGLFVYETKGESLARPNVNTFGLGSLPSGKKSHHKRSSTLDRPGLLRIMSQDRPELRMGLGLRKRMTTVDASREVVVVTDPYSTGCLIVKEVQSRGYKVIVLWTRGFSEEMKKHVPLSCGKMNYFAEVDEADDVGETTRQLYKAAGTLRIVACIAGGEAGVDAADVLSERLLVRTNGAQGVFANRRDKKVQQELLKAAGMRSVRQAAGTEWNDTVESFLKNETYPVVLKPTDSAGSDGVKLCHNYEEAKEHFHALFEIEAVNGGFNTEVLCQEFLRGKEYVVDTVSRDGEHKTCAVWVYDKRAANGAAFVYFGMVPIDTSTQEAKLLINYCNRTLDALKMQNGPSHAEIILTASGPCLVEMNCRAQGGDGNWQQLAQALTGGYSQVEASVDAYLDKKAFSVLPQIPPSPAKAFGQEVILVSYAEGEVVATPGYDVIKKLESFVYLETGVATGSHVEHTVDLVTSVGSVILLHQDEDVVKKDIATIRELEKNNKLFDFVKNSMMMKAVSTLNFQNLSLSNVM
eukprot:scaffold42277_cov153-Skeletonema_marinoi.AAC.1